MSVSMCIGQRGDDSLSPSLSFSITPYINNVAHAEVLGWKCVCGGGSGEGEDHILHFSPYEQSLELISICE